MLVCEGYGDVFGRTWGCVYWGVGFDMKVLVGGGWVVGMSVWEYGRGGKVWGAVGSCGELWLRLGVWMECRALLIDLLHTLLRVLIHI